MRIKFNLIQDIYDFVAIAQQYEGKISLRQDHYLIDGKSVFGLFALDLTKEIALTVDGFNYERFMRWAVKEV